MKPYAINNSISHFKNIQKYLPGGVHSNFHTAKQSSGIFFQRAQGSRLWDVDDNEYLDLSGRSGALLLGHNNLEYVNSLKEFMEYATITDYMTLCEKVCEKLSSHLSSCEMMRFGQSGTEAAMNAVRLARAYTGRNTVIKFEGHYHGSADSIMANQYYEDYEPYDSGAGIFSTSGRAKNCLKEQLLLVPWNDKKSLEEAISLNPGKIAAIITEPICMNGGGIMPEEGYLTYLRKLCSDHGIILILDEIITGIRLGIGGAQKKYNIVPDLCLMGKSLSGGGLPISMIGGKKEIMKLLDEGKVVQAGTFNGYSLGLAAVNTTLDIILKHGEEYYEKMNKISQIIYDIFTAQAKRSGVELVMQGPVACTYMHCGNQVITSFKEYDKALLSRNALLHSCFQRYGILLASPTKIYPSFAMEEGDIAFVEKRIKTILDTAAIIMQKVRFS